MVKIYFIVTVSSDKAHLGQTDQVLCETQLHWLLSGEDYRLIWWIAFILINNNNFTRKCFIAWHCRISFRSKWSIRIHDFIIWIDIYLITYNQALRSGYFIKHGYRNSLNCRSTSRFDITNATLVRNRRKWMGNVNKAKHMLSISLT